MFLRTRNYSTNACFEEERKKNPVALRTAGASKIQTRDWWLCIFVSSFVGNRATVSQCSLYRLMELQPLLISTPLTSSLLAPDWPRPRPRLRCCCCCRRAAVGTSHERQQNGWQHAKTADNCIRAAVESRQSGLLDPFVIQRVGLLFRSMYCIYNPLRWPGVCWFLLISLYQLRFNKGTTVNNFVMIENFVCQAAI